MAANSGNPTEKDVDLFYLIKKIGDLFDRFGYFIYRFFLFVKRNLVIILLLLAVGIGGGYFLDTLRKDDYRHEIIVVPNFGSTTYLYDYIDAISLKDSPIKSINIEPIVNVYDLVKERYNNLELIKEFSSSDINYSKYEKNSGVEQFYRYHLLTIYTDESNEVDQIINNLLVELNNDSYYIDRQKVEIKNTEKLIQELNLSIDNINKILEKFSSSEIKSGGVNVENYSELNELVNVKKNMMDELNRWKISTIEQEKVIYDAARITNIKENKISLMLVLPVVLLLSFFGIVILKSFFKRYEAYKVSLS